MSGWTYGKFCLGCPNEVFCDWYCSSEKYCAGCVAYEQGFCNVSEGLCNNQVSTLKRFFRNRFHKLLGEIRFRKMFKK